MRFENAEGPERETGDPTPRGTRPLMEISTSAPSVPFFGVVDSNDVVLMHNRMRREAHFRAMTATQPSMAPLFYIKPHNPQGPERETGDSTPRGARALSAASSSGDISIEIPAGSPQHR
jgi:hypothetical protein